MSEPVTEKHVVGFARPNILVSCVDENGVATLTVREGATMSLNAITTREKVDSPPDDSPFRILSTNRINFAGGVINVINDECDYSGKHLDATSPTASEYLALVGKEVVKAINVRTDLDRQIKTGESGFIVGRTKIILP